METYRTVKTSFWTDARVVDEFTPEDKYFYLYALTNPHANLCGCYEISVKQMETETGYNTDTIKRLLERFFKYGLLEYSEETRELLILNWPKHQWTASPKLDKPLLSCIKKIKCQRFKEYLGEIYNKRNTVSIPYQYGIDTSYSYSYSYSYSNTNSNSNLNNTEKLNNIDRRKAKQEKTKEQEQKFSLFWNAYPKKVSKAAAEKAFNKLKPDDELLETMFEAIEQQKRSAEWQKDGGQFIPYPATWLNGRRWEDESGGGNMMPDYDEVVPGIDVIDVSY